MINAVNGVKQSVRSGFPIPFASTRICTGCSARHEEGSSRFVLLKPGIYKINFHSVFGIISDNEGTITLGIEIDGEPVVGGKITNTVKAGELYSGSVTIPVRVYNCDSTTITINNLSDIPVELEDSAIIVERIG